MKLGTIDIEKIYVGSNEIEKGYVGSSEVYSAESPIDYTVPFYVEDASGSSNTLTIKKNNASAPTLTIQKSIDGSTWQTMGTTSTTAITATVPANSKLYLRTSATGWCTYSSSNYYYNNITCSGVFNVGGNIMSLLYGSNFNGEEIAFPSGSTYTFRSLFQESTTLRVASKLLLPATTLVNYCYENMFYGCTSLTTAPALPATTLVTFSYANMFYGCTSLTTAPALPATTLANYCYNNMFRNCTSLTTVPVFSPTELVSYSSIGMFSGCTSLTETPIIKCNLGYRSASSMFSGCTNLTKVTYLGLTKPSYNGGYGNSVNWLSGTPSNGTFVMNNAAEYEIERSASGVPEGWTIERIDV